MKRDMTSGKEWIHILLFTLPIMAGNLLQQLYSIIDGAIVGHYVGEHAFAAVATCHSLVFLYLSLAIGLSIGVGIVVAQYFGAGRNNELPIAIDTSLILLSICGLVFTILGVALSEVLLRDLLGVPLSLLPDAVTYMRIYSLGLLFQFVYNGIAATLRGLGDSKATLYFLLITMILNTALTFLFVAVIEWGVAGAAFSTVLAQFVCVAVSYGYLRKRFPYKKAEKHWDGTIAKNMTKLGLPIAIQLGIVSFGSGAMQRLANRFYHTVPGVVAAFGAAIRLDMFIMVPIIGFQSGLASFAGQNIGAGRLDRVRRGLKATLLMSFLTSIVVSLLFNIFAEPAIALFGLTGNALILGAQQVRFVTMFFWIFAVYMAVGGVLQGAGDTVLMSVATLTALAVRILTGYLAVHLGILEHTAAWATIPIEFAVALIITLIRYFTGGWKNKAVAGALQHGK